MLFINSYNDLHFIFRFKGNSRKRKEWLCVDARCKWISPKGARKNLQQKMLRVKICKPKGNY